MGEPVPAWVSRRGRKGKAVAGRRDWGDGRRRSSTRSRRLGGGGRADHRAHRRRHLDRLGHPRLPRPATACGRRTRRPRRWRRSSTTSPTPRSAGWRGRTGWRRRRGRPSPTPATGPSSSSSGRGKLHAVVTQNVDGLHQKAGTAAELVVEVHGTIWWTRCWDCQDRRPMAETLDRVRAGEDDPPCLVCGGILKSDTISFGQALVPEVIDRALQVSEECDLLLAVGSTLSVYPAANCVPRAKAAGRPGRHRQRRADRDGPPRRRRPPRPDRRRCLPGHRRLELESRPDR